MVDRDFSMHDTLDNISFSDVKSQFENSDCGETEISFDDSSFLKNVSFYCEQNDIAPNTKENECVLKNEELSSNEETCTKSFRSKRVSQSYVNHCPYRNSNNQKNLDISDKNTLKNVTESNSHNIHNNSNMQFDLIDLPNKPNANSENNNAVHQAGTKQHDYNNIKLKAVDLPSSNKPNANSENNIVAHQAGSNQHGYNRNKPNANLENNNVVYQAESKEHNYSSLNFEVVNLNLENNNIHQQHDSKSVVNNAISETTSINCELSTWQLPEKVLDKYASRNIKRMFPWQLECLSNSKVLHEHCNLIYSAPTSAGKTLVAEILALKTIFNRMKKVIFILPFVSIVREKMYYFQDILSSSGIRAEGFMGSYNPPGGFNSVHFAICTIEKANSLINKLLEEDKLSEVGSVFIDEMHLLGDSHRGYLLELLLTKLKYISLKNKSINIQIIGMSATLPNLDELAKWLEAELYSTTFRPIPLYEQLSVCGRVYDRNFQLIKQLEPLDDVGVDTDYILQLCLDTIKDSCSVLIFCPTKNWCENLAQQLSLAFFKIGNKNSLLGEVLRNQIKADLILEVLEQLKFCPAGLDLVLKKAISFGVAFHHAGLTMDERDIIEGAFRNGAIKVLIATSTLSSGVNLPARKVIIRSPIFCGRPLDILTYQQMVGRAGRMGKDSKGESVLICQKNDCEFARQLMSGTLPAVESCLEGAGKLKRAILEVIASGVALSPEDVTLFTNCTLLAVNQVGKYKLEDPIGQSIEFLREHEFVRLQKDAEGREKYVATALGKACLSSSIAPDEGLALFTELAKARQCFVLETELHLIYLVTPYSASNSWGNIDWMFYLDLWDKLPPSMKKVGELVGVTESYIVKATRGKIETSNTKAYHKMMVHKRFFVSLVLQDLVNEVPLADVCVKFNCNRGMLQSLQQSAATFAGMVTSFSRQLGWTSVEILLAQFQDRMQFGISRDLLDLMRLPSLNGKLARTLYKLGIETLIQLANSDVNIVENMLQRVGPFESSKERDGETEFETKQRNNLRTVWVTGKDGLTEREAAKLLVDDARNYLERELGLKDAKWATNSNKDDEVHEKSNAPDNKCAAKLSNEKKLEIEPTIIGSTACGLVSRIHIAQCNEQSPEVSSLQTQKIIETFHNFPDKLSAVKSLTNNVMNMSENLKLHTNDTKFNSDYNIISKNYGICEEPETNKNNKLLNLNILENCIFNQSKSSDDKDLSDNSLLLQISIGSSDKETSSVLSQNIEAFESQDNFDSIVRNIEFFDKKDNTKAKELQCTGLALNSDSKNSDETFFISRKRVRLVSEDVFFETTPTKKNRGCNENSKGKLTPISSTIKKYSQLNLNDNIASRQDLKINILEIHKPDCVDKFITDLKSKCRFAFSLVCSRKLNYIPLIGGNILCKKGKEDNLDHFTYGNKKVEGFAFYWEDIESYFLPIDNISRNKRVLDRIIEIFKDEHKSICIFNAKEQIKILMKCFDVEFLCKIEDPKVIDWFLDVDGREKSLQTLINIHCHNLTEIAELCATTKSVSSFGLNINSTEEPKVRGLIDVVATWNLINTLKLKLVSKVPKVNQIVLTGFPKSYDLEMQTILCISEMEVNGIAADEKSLAHLAEQLKRQQSSIEKKAYSSAGRRFNFNSSTDVSKVIGTFNGKKVSTKKQVLEQSDHPISKLIIYWRKINFTLEKTVYPLIRHCENNRIHGCFISHTATGRLSMHEPNIQMVPKDFNNLISNEEVLISCRRAFIVNEDLVLVSADYCQLELRILTYLSKDSVLTNIMGKPGDIFKAIAANWNNVPEEMVDNEMRQNAKQLCYGIIYGMGSKTLAEQLNISTEDAAIFMESFRNKYLGIKEFIKKTIDFCRKNGYVETIVGRRRYLPHITDDDASAVAQAERQAVNTRVQGSAADIVKNAMITIYSEINRVFKKSRFKAKLVLHLHDELIYEVPMKYIEKSIKIIKYGMENTASVIGYFPVKIKIGRSWGELKEFDISNL